MEGPIHDCSMPGIKRLDCNFIFKDSVSDVVAESEIRYWLFNIWMDNQDVKALNIKCFYIGKNLCFKGADLAPYGDWVNAATSPNARLDSYQVKFY